MKKTLFLAGLIVSVCLFAGCTSDDWAVVADSLNAANEAHTFYFVNNSGYSVHLTTTTGFTYDLSPGETAYGNFNAWINVNNVTYSPSNYVSVSQSGDTFTFY
jgi:3-deoxy-D-arabino-heptulosonate 7-phosphate (DAHP) synthase